MQKKKQKLYKTNFEKSEINRNEITLETRNKFLRVEFLIKVLDLTVLKKTNMDDAFNQWHYDTARGLKRKEKQTGKA